MIANGVSKFLSFSLQVYIIRLKKSRSVKNFLFYPKNEVIVFPKIEIMNEIESAMFMILMWEPVKHLRTKLPSANMWCKQTHH